MSTPKDVAKIYYASIGVQSEFNAALPNYKQELKLFNCVQNGDLANLETVLRESSMLAPKIGHMSNNPVQQAQFIVVSGITLATRYAIVGGLPEAEALRLSDAYLQKLGTTLHENEALSLFFVALRDFTQRVQRFRAHASRSLPVTKCIRYIANHLYDHITLSTLAKECQCTPQYLSTVFHKEFGVTPTQYIREKKLNLAKQLLLDSNYSISRISNMLEFPSQAAFSHYFKQEYDVTPSDFRNQ